jgi:hypothetical protein
VNLEPTANQQLLVASLRRATAAAPEGATASEVLDAAGFTTPRWGLLDWCLALEELGAAGHDVALLEPVACSTTDTHTDTHTDRALIARAAHAVGVGRACLDLAQARAADRAISGRRLLELQGPAHRLANAAVLVSDARIGVWRAATGEDAGTPAGSWAAACAAASVHAAVTAAHELVQIHGAAGTGDRRVVALYRAAYALPLACGSPRLLWERAGRQWLAENAPNSGAC